MIELTNDRGKRVAIDPMSITYIEECEAGTLISLAHRAVKVRDQYDMVLRQYNEWEEETRAPHECGGYQQPFDPEDN